MPDKGLEIFAFQDFARITGEPLVNVREADSSPALGDKERGIDVVFDYRGRHIGGQHTQFHFDEGPHGSPTRAEERRRLQQPNIDGLSFGIDYRPSLAKRIADKITIAGRHDLQGIVDEAWLLVSASLPKLEAAVSTLIRPEAVRVEDLNAMSHAELTNSKFMRAFLVLHTSEIVYSWDRHGWKRIADLQASQRQLHKANNMAVLDRIGDHFARHRI